MNESFVVRSSRRERFTQVDNRIFDDWRLDLAATGLLCYLLSKPDGWVVYINDIRNRFNVGVYIVRNRLAILEECGYIQRGQRRDNGKFSGWEYQVFEEPVGGFPPKRENPHTVNPRTDNLTHSNTDSSNTNSSNIKNGDFLKIAEVDDGAVDGITAETTTGLRLMQINERGEIETVGELPPAKSCEGSQLFPGLRLLAELPTGVLCEATGMAPPDGGAKSCEGSQIATSGGHADGVADDAIAAGKEVEAWLEKKSQKVVQIRRSLEEIHEGRRRALEKAAENREAKLTELQSAGITPDTAARILDYVAKVPEIYQDLAFAFCKGFGRDARGNECKTFISEYKQLAEIDVTPDDIAAAFKELKGARTPDGKRLTIGSPRSLQKTANKYVGIRREAEAKKLAKGPKIHKCKPCRVQETMDKIASGELEPGEIIADDLADFYDPKGVHRDAYGNILP